MKVLIPFFLWLLLPRAAFAKTIALSVGLLCIPAISNTQALLAPIDKSISTSISKYGNQEGDLIILSLSLEECAACSSFPLLTADLCDRHFRQDLKYLVPYEEEMFLAMFEDKFDIDLTSGQSQLIVDERLYSSMQTGAKSRILIVDNKKVEYFGLMQDFLDDYQALLGKEELTNCDDTLEVCRRLSSSGELGG